MSVYCLRLDNSHEGHYDHLDEKHGGRPMSVDQHSSDAVKTVRIGVGKLKTGRKKVQ